MKYFQIICSTYDYESGQNEEVLTESFNEEQLVSISNKLNKKYGTSPKKTDYTIKFFIKSIDTSKIPNSLSKEDIGRLLKRDSY